MIDVGAKQITRRFAAASAVVNFSPQAFQQLLEKGSTKGDVFETAKTAGIMAAKSTPFIIPLCHPLPLTQANVRFLTDEKKSRVIVTAEIRCRGKTGVEMEALTAAAVSALTIYDMMKWCDPAIVISDLQLLKKSGGKSGDFERE